MSQSQFEKRRAKLSEALKEKRDKIREGANEAPAAEVTDKKEAGPEYTHEGFDIFMGPGNNKHFAIQFEYNPISQDVRVKSIDPIQRAVALTFDNNKRALRTLLRKK